MGIFDRAKQLETREGFLAYRARSRRYSEDQLSEVKEYIFSDECVHDLDRLENGDYFLDYPLYRLISKQSSTKKRAIYIFQGKQGILLKLIVYAMHGIESVYSDRLFSFRSDRTAKDLLFEVRDSNALQDLYILKTDVSNYVGSIVPELLLPMLEEIFMRDDKAFFRFLEWLLTRNKVMDHEGNIIDHCPGGMGGVPLGNLFMNLYLREMDAYFAPQAAFYSRYSDDIMICAHTCEEIRHYEEKYYVILDRLRLATNQEKTQILKPGEAFDLLGMRLCGGRITISEHSMMKIKRKLRRFADKALISRNTGKMTADEAAQMLIIRFNRYFFGVDGDGTRLSWARWAFPVITDTMSLEEIDHYFQESIRYVLYGSMKKRKCSIPYKKLSSLGYRTLVYYYHHQDRIRDIPREYAQRRDRNGRE